MSAAFARALLQPDAPCPAGLKTWNGSDPAKRFAVYRNNVVVSLVD
ncbi:MAG: putative DNA-binding domain-containing protein, partial [Ideonella sp.]|nr:putative DNA-binding domain-containing protein [Ideonella sp.]